MRRLLSLLLMLGACAPPASDPQAPAVMVGREPAPDLGAIKATVEAEAQRLYGEECGKVALPDRAFIPVEITGGGLPEYVVLLGRAHCERMGSSQRWQGTGGAGVQVWLASGGPPRMLLEHQMHGFTPMHNGFSSLQHGAFCPGGGGPGVCLVVYGWNEKDRALAVLRRQSFDDEHPGEPPSMEYGYETISR